MDGHVLPKRNRKKKIKRYEDNVLKHLKVKVIILKLPTVLVARKTERRETNKQ